MLDVSQVTAQYFEVNITASFVHTLCVQTHSAQDREDSFTAADPLPAVSATILES